MGCAFVLLWVACSSNPVKGKLEGTWKAKDGSKLVVSGKKFAMDDDEEDYFIKGDTIFTSFEGNLPYTRFVMQQLDEHNLKLVGPDSTLMEYSR